MSNDERDAKIERCLSRFDFEKVRKAMKALNWKWCSAEGGVPSVYELIEKSRELLQDVCRTTNGCSVYTGGLHAELIDDELKLSFQVSRSNSKEYNV